MRKKEKKRWGDRKDGTLIRNLDSLHFIMPMIYPNRCDNEGYISVKVDLEKINAYLEQLNAKEQELPYTMFHIIAAALVKTIHLRPKLNRFIANKNFYQRNEVSTAFVVKKKFSDKGEEALAFIHTTEDMDLGGFHNILKAQILECRSEDSMDSSTESMNIVTKLPRILSKTIAWAATKLDAHGKVPASLIETDPYYSSCVISNLGSIKLKSGYHHLTNWGTCSLFCIIGEKKKKPVFDEEGHMEMREILELGLTIDERLADGYYYSKSIRLLEYILQHPECLEKPFKEEIVYDTKGK